MAVQYQMSLPVSEADFDEQLCRALDAVVLQRRCRELGLPPAGRKLELCRRIAAAGFPLEGEPGEQPSVRSSGLTDEGYSMYTAKDLREVIETGVKQEEDEKLSQARETVISDLCLKLNADFLQWRARRLGLDASGPKREICARIEASGKPLTQQKPPRVKGGRGITRDELEFLIEKNKAVLSKTEYTLRPGKLDRPIGIWNIARRAAEKAQHNLVILQAFYDAKKPVSDTTLNATLK